MFMQKRWIYEGWSGALGSFDDLEERAVKRKVEVESYRNCI